MKVLLLSIAPLIWGLGFIASRYTFEAYDAYWSHGIRYALTGFFVCPVLFFYKNRINWKASFLLALVLSTALILQTIGIKLTSIAKSSFLTTLYIIFTPLLNLIMNKNFPEKKTIFYIVIALIGVFLLCNFEIESINIGDLITILSSVFFALHIIMIDKYASSNAPIILNLSQCLLMAPMGVIVAFILGSSLDLTPLLYGHENFNHKVLLGFIILSIFSSIIAFSIQIYAQKDIKPDHAALIFLLESPIAAIFAYFLFQEDLTYMAISGCILIMIPSFLLSRSQ